MGYVHKKLSFEVIEYTHSVCIVFFFLQFKIRLPVLGKKQNVKLVSILYHVMFLIKTFIVTTKLIAAENSPRTKT